MTGIDVVVAMTGFVPDRRIEGVLRGRGKHGRVRAFFSKLALAVSVVLVPEVVIGAQSAPCQPVTYEHGEYTVCAVDLRRQTVKLFWKKPDGQPYE